MSFLLWKPPSSLPGGEGAGEGVIAGLEQGGVPDGFDEGCGRMKCVGNSSDKSRTGWSDETGEAVCVKSKLGALS